MQNIARLREELNNAANEVNAALRRLNRIRACLAHLEHAGTTSARTRAASRWGMTDWCTSSPVDPDELGIEIPATGTTPPRSF